MPSENAKDSFHQYAKHLYHLLSWIRATDGAGAALLIDGAISQVIQLARDAHAAGRRVQFIGNGGSAGIASHMAIDYSKSGIRSTAYNDVAALTCLANDFGYEEVFARQISLQAQPGDVLVAISSSGESRNIVLAAADARRIGCTVVTMSGFSPENALRRCGDINFYSPSGYYGQVELSHFCLCHAILDIACDAWPIHAEETKLDSIA